MVSEELTNIQKEILMRQLTTTIEVDKRVKTITKSEDIFISPQTYRRSADPDVSDLAIAFYEIVYESILPHALNEKPRILGRREEDKGKDKFYTNVFADDLFAGDTMNSFNTVAGKAIKGLKIKGTPIGDVYYMPVDAEGRLRMILDSDAEEMTKNAFKAYYALYHSLANFWVIPTSIGRESKKEISLSIQGKVFATQDYMTIFLDKIESNREQLFASNSEAKDAYFNAFDSYEDFLAKHQIVDTDYPASEDKPSLLANELDEKTATNIVFGMIHAIKNRAQHLVVSNYAEQLWDLLNNSSL